MDRTKRTVLVAASIVALLVTAGQASASAEAPADEQGPQRGRSGVTTHPPAGDKVRIWVAIPMSTRSRPVCAYPLAAKYKGRGSTGDAASFECSTGF